MYVAYDMQSIIAARALYETKFNAPEKNAVVVLMQPAFIQCHKQIKRPTIINPACRHSALVC